MFDFINSFAFCPSGGRNYWKETLKNLKMTVLSLSNIYTGQTINMEGQYGKKKLGVWGFCLTVGTFLLLNQPNKI